MPGGLARLLPGTKIGTLTTEGTEVIWVRSTADKIEIK
jgi:hypothetical protein